MAHPHDPGWDEAARLFPILPGSRQVFALSIGLVQTSCGAGVPIMPFRRSRVEEELLPVFDEMSSEGGRI